MSHAAVCRFLCVFGAGGEHLHTLGAEGSHAFLQQLNWLDDTSVSACSGSEVTVWSVSQEQYQETCVFAAHPNSNITCLAASPNGQYLAAACDNGMVGGQQWLQSQATVKAACSCILQLSICAGDFHGKPSSSWPIQCATTYCDAK